MKSIARAHWKLLPYQPNSNRWFERARQLPYPVLMDSNAGHTNGRFDIVSAMPRVVICDGDFNALYSPEVRDEEDIEFLSCPASSSELVTLVDQQIHRLTSAPDCPLALPFISGAIGLFSYNWGEYSMGIRSRHQQAADSCQGYHWPTLQLGIYQWALVQDHLQQQAVLVADPKIPRQQWQLLEQLFSEVNNTKNRQAFELTSNWQSNTSRRKYQAMFNQVIDYIHSGDTYQINLAQRFSATYRGDPWTAFNALKRRSPTPFSAYLETPYGAVASLSPERFISVEGKTVITQPIKGTIRRGCNNEEDQQLIAQLASSQKDRAENLMIVDLMRNDIGRNCETGSVGVDALFRIETHPNVHHLVSTVKGRLRDDSSPLGLVCAALPGGSVTGAPKKRSMEIIRQLEPNGRSIYCGSLAYFDSRGFTDSSILIRSMLFEKNGEVHCWGGGGIVADSDCDAEYQESLQKISNLLGELSSPLPA